MEDPTRSDAPSVVDVTSEWGAALQKQAAKDPEKLQVSGSARSLPPSVVADAPKIRTSDVEPLVKAIGAIGTRLARVSPISDEEAHDVAEPTAKLLELVAPNMPPWAIPLSILGARLGDIVEKRADEFRANRPKSEEKDSGPGEQGDEEAKPTLVEADAF